MIKIYECDHQYLETRLNQLSDKGYTIISVTWRGVPHSKYTVVYHV